MPPASLEAAFIPSDGVQLLGGLYRASGEAPTPAALLLHGLPGHEKNLDLAAELRQFGLHCLYFHYRGAWGSPGRFSVRHLLTDATAAFDWLAQQPEVDAKRIALIGFSLGGWAACALACQRTPAALVALSPLVDSRLVPLPPDLARESAATLQGTTAEQLTSEWSTLAPLTDIASSIPPVPTLLVTGGRDSLFPPGHAAPLAASLPGATHIQFPQADHTFSDVRPGLRRVVAPWLAEVLQL